MVCVFLFCKCDDFPCYFNKKKVDIKFDLLAGKLIIQWNKFYTFRFCLLVIIIVDTVFFVRLAFGFVSRSHLKAFCKKCTEIKFTQWKRFYVISIYRKVALNSNVIQKEKKKSNPSKMLGKLMNQVVQQRYLKSINNNDKNSLKYCDITDYQYHEGECTLPNKESAWSF